MECKYLVSYWEGARLGKEWHQCDDVRTVGQTLKKEKGPDGLLGRKKDCCIYIVRLDFIGAIIEDARAREAMICVISECSVLEQELGCGVINCAVVTRGRGNLT